VGEPIEPYQPARLVSLTPQTSPEPAVTTHDVQAAVEGAPVADDSNSVEFLGKRFRLAESIGLMPLLAFANSSKQGMDSDDMEGMAAMYALIRDTVDQTRVQKTDEDGKLVYDSAGEPEYEGPSDWQRFEKHAIDEKADGEELMEFIRSAMGVISARPRKRRGTSSDSSPRTSPSSKDSSSSPVTRPQIEGLVAVADIGRAGR
jgi:hypothetical protein